MEQWPRCDVLSDDYCRDMQACLNEHVDQAQLREQFESFLSRSNLTPVEGGFDLLWQEWCKIVLKQSYLVINHADAVQRSLASEFQDLIIEAFLSQCVQTDGLPITYEDKFVGLDEFTRLVAKEIVSCLQRHNFILVDAEKVPVELAPELKATLVGVAALCERLG